VSAAAQHLMPDRRPQTRLEHHGHGLSEVTIDRAHRRNALSWQVLEEILVHLSTAESMGRRALVLRGSGGFFCAGADLAEMSGTRDDEAWLAKLAEVGAALAGCGLVTVAAVEGGCLGSGLELAAACDIRLASPTSFFAFPAVDMGLVYHPGAIARLVAVCGVTAASRLLLTGSRLSAQEAQATGLMTQVVSDGMPAALRMLDDRLSVLPPYALMTTTRMVRTLARTSALDEHWHAVHLESLSSHERHDAVARRRDALAKVKER
jgi:enoyl-CoA hydratase/carnithine racemase